MFADSSDCDNLEIVVELENHAVLAPVESAPSGERLAQCFRTTRRISGKYRLQFPCKRILDIPGKGFCIFQAVASELNSISQATVPRKPPRRNAASRSEPQHRSY